MSQSYQSKLAQLKDREHPFAPFIRILGKGKTGSRSLSRSEAYEAMRMILRGEVEDIQLGAFLMLLRVKEESPEELSGFVLGVRDHINAPANQIIVDLDWSSYAGKKRQLPWYLLACFAIADQGINIFMHGASGHTIGRLYTEDVLAALNVPVARGWDNVHEQLNQCHFCFMPLQYLCPELKQMMDFRNYLGLRSPVHTLSRLINPLGANYSIQSVFHPAYGDSHQQAGIDLEQSNAAVFKGEGGEIERKPEADCTVKRIVDGRLSEQIWPRLLEGRQPQPEHLDVNEVVSVWRGERENPYGVAAIIGTMAIAIELLGKANSQTEAMTLAENWWQQRNRHRL